MVASLKLAAKVPEHQRLEECFAALTPGLSVWQWVAGETCCNESSGGSYAHPTPFLTMKEIIENPGCMHCRPVLLSFSCVFIYPSGFRRSLIIMAFHIISSHPYAFRAACHVRFLGTPVVKKAFARDREVVSNICMQPFLRIDRNPWLCMLLLLIKVKYLSRTLR